jgi:hypothetical protein
MRRYAIFYGIVLTTATLLGPVPSLAFPVSPSSLLLAVDGTNLLADVRAARGGGRRAGGAAPVHHNTNVNRNAHYNTNVNRNVHHNANVNRNVNVNVNRSSSIKVIRNPYVNVNRAVGIGVGAVRPWVRRPYFGTVVGGVALGAIIAATAVPVVPASGLCWYWTDETNTQGYWDYCQ